MEHPRTRAPHLFRQYVRETASTCGVILKAVFFPLVFFGAGAAVAPLMFIGMILGMFPNILTAAFSWFITIPLTCLFPFHALYALMLIIFGKSPDYTKGIYGALAWVERNRLYDPTFSKKSNETKGSETTAQ